jgi:hypothetical protein
MTHTLHREGTGESLEDDLLLLITPAIGRNDPGAAEKLKHLIDIIFERGPANYGCYERGRNIFSGVTADEIKETTGDRSRIRCVFSDREKFRELIMRIVKENTGLSVTVSGLMSIVREIAADLGLKPHSVNLSLGVHGNRDLLPHDDIRQITTMCGHGMVAPNLVKNMIGKVKRGRLTPQEAAVELAKPCICGVFNTERASTLLQRMLPFWCIHHR